jgi:N-acetylglucosaminyldiphosphoundecaprenol N-acetyl-beta-D-mannosaminyltransferase
MTGRYDYDGFGIRISKLLVAEFISRIRTSIAQRAVFTVSYAHFDTINIICSSASAREAFAALDLVTPDGGALPWALRRLGAPFHREDSLSCEYTMPALCLEAVREGWSFFLFGGDPGVAARAAARLKAAFPSITVIGTHHGHLKSEAELQGVLEEIQRLKPNILLVGMGQPKQEEWIVKNRNVVGEAVMIGVGGYLEKLSHRITGYPTWVYRTKLFWLYRLATEPKRVWRRYAFGFVMFGVHVWRAKRADLLAKKLC